jgi:hypothetical protein
VSAAAPKEDVFTTMQPELRDRALAGAKDTFATDNVGAVAHLQIVLDERASLMASVGASMVVCKILHGVKSKSFYDQSGLEKKLVYVEDIISYIHDTYGDVITLDQSSSDAFERMTREQRRNHERKLLKDMLSDEDHSGVVKTVANATDQWAFYEEKANAMIKVEAANVGKLWETSLHTSAKMRVIFHQIRQDTDAVLTGSPRIHIATNLKIKGTGTLAAAYSDAKNDIMHDGTPRKLAIEILSLVVLHVLTYANTAALDFYFKLAHRAGEHNFTGDNNVITHSVYAPGLLAALKMYGISEAAFDDEMAFQINTNADVKELFKAAHKAYDTNGANLVGAKTFKSEVDTVPSWLVPKEEQLKYEQEFARTKGVAKATAPVRVAPNATVGGIAGNIAAAATLASNRNLAKHVRAVTGFGRRRRRRSSAFGRRKRSSKKKTSFGRRKRSSKKKASFGRRRRRASTRK